MDDYDISSIRNILRQINNKLIEVDSINLLSINNELKTINTNLKEIKNISNNNLKVDSNNDKRYELLLSNAQNIKIIKDLLAFIVLIIIIAVIVAICCL